MAVLSGMRLRTWEAIVVGLAAGVFCSVVWTVVVRISCPSVFRILPWLCWPIVVVVTAAVTTGILLLRRHRRRKENRTWNPRHPRPPL